MPSAIVSVEVERQSDSSLTVRWEAEGDPVAVDIAVGETPDGIDHRHQTTVAAGQLSVQLPPQGSGRRFVSVTPRGGGPTEVAADRRLPFEGVTNFRDLGGYLTRSGTRVRWGLVFRADALHGFSPADLALYDQLDLQVVFDLRTDLERQERPNPVSSRWLEIAGRPPDEPVQTTSRFSAAEGEQLLLEVYLGVLEYASAQLGELFTALASEGGLPAVFHCHAGKDRTGIAAALLLEALGVRRATILDDYELTSRYRLRTQQEPTFDRLLGLGFAPEAAAAVLTTPRWAMDEALRHIDTRYGGIEAYLTGRAGMRVDDLRLLRQRLTEPVPM